MAIKLNFGLEKPRMAQIIAAKDKKKKKHDKSFSFSEIPPDILKAQIGQPKFWVFLFFFNFFLFQFF